MTAPPEHWIFSLRSHGDAKITSLVSARELREAVTEVGEPAAHWALLSGEELAEQISKQMPEVTQGRAAFTALRRAMQSAVLAMVVAVRVGVVRDDTITEETRDSVGVLVATGVELTSVLAAVRRGHALLVERLMQECRTLVPTDEQFEQFASISELCFDFVGKLADGLTQLHLDEQQRWQANPLAKRLALIDRILDGQNEDLTRAAAVLRYEILFRHHLAVCVWPTDNATADELESAAMQFLLAHHTSQTLIARQPDGTVLAWGNSHSPIPEPAVDGFKPLHGARVAVSRPAFSEEGFRDSAAEARDAMATSQRLPGLASAPLTLFSEANLLGLLSTDFDRATGFVRTELGRLADDDDSNARLLETVEAYLDSHSPQTVAHELFIARNTVAYRLRKVEDLLGRPITSRQLELRVAIRLVRALRDAPSHDERRGHG